MNDTALFTWTFVTTILATRILLFFKPISSPTLGGMRLHHYMLGAVLVLAGFALRSTLLSSIGLAWVVDETTFVVIGGKTHADNYSPTSLIGTILLMAVVVLLRFRIVEFLAS